MNGTKRLRWLVATIAICAGIAASALLPCATALAAENSWRYREGELVLPLDGDGQAGDVRALGTATSHWQKSGGQWQTTYDGEWTTVNARSFGVDVSSWNGHVDWAAAKRDGVEFAILRCGTNVDDPTRDDTEFVANVRGCLQNGIPFGVYLYSYADSVEEANSEADHALRMLREAGAQPDVVTYPVYYDLEESSLADTRYTGLLASMAETFCTRLESAGYRAGVYANRWWWTTFLTDPVFYRWERWVADWGQSGANARVPYGEPYAIWQCMATGYVDGIGECDIDFDYYPRTYDSPGVPEEDLVAGGVYRLYDLRSGEHLFSTDANEVKGLRRSGWTYEGRAWIAPSEGVPVYRLYSPVTKEHHYTADANERAILTTRDHWNDEGIVWYSPSETEGATPVYRLNNPTLSGPGAHHYTTDAHERDVLAAGDWSYEGVCWYGLS